MIVLIMDSILILKYLKQYMNIEVQENALFKHCHAVLHCIPPFFLFLYNKYYTYQVCIYLDFVVGRGLK